MLLLFTGYLQKLYPDGIRVACTTVYDAIYALRFYPGFDPAKDKHHIQVEGFNTLALLHADCGPHLTVTIHPFLGGAGGGERGGWTQLLVGAALIALAAFAPPFAGAAAGSMAAKMGGFITNVGIGLAIGGAMRLLFPTPEATPAKKDAKSRLLGSQGNTTAIGTPIPIILGQYRVYGHYLSFDVDAKDYDPRAED